MGRRKLTKILLESACDKDSKNKQSETASDISRRKNLVDIIAILQNPPPVLSQQDREEQADKDRTRDRSGKADKKREKTSTSSKENDGGFKRDKKRVMCVSAFPMFSAKINCNLEPGQAQPGGFVRILFVLC